MIGELQAAAGLSPSHRTRFVPEMTLYQRFCHEALLPISDLVLGQGVRTRLDELLRFQWAPAAQIEDYRAQRLRELVTFSVNRVPFYRTVFREYGIDPND